MARRYPRLAIHLPLQQVVAEKLALEWSPEQIAGWLRVEYPGEFDIHMSHETIYRSLFIQARGVLKKVGEAPALAPDDALIKACEHRGAGMRPDY